MLQYFKFNENAVENKRYQLLPGKKAYLILSKSALVSIFMMYATFFVAAAIPFLSPNNPAVFIIGGVISLAILARTVIFFARFFTFGAGDSFTVSKNGITITKKGKESVIASSAIEYLEYNLIGDLVVKERDRSTAFPVHLLDIRDRTELLALFADMTPSRTRFIKKIHDLGDAIIVAMIVAVHVIQLLVQNFYLPPSGSMENTLMDEDRLFAEKLTYGPRIPRMIGMSKEIQIKIPFITREVRRGDIIIFTPPLPGDQDKEYIKRCIAVEGDEFHIRDGYVWLNGRKQDNSYIKGETNYRNFPSSSLIEGIVPKGYIIAMGDNRQHSSDSRFFGYVPVERVKSRAFFLYWNWTQGKGLDFSRFGIVR